MNNLKSLRKEFKLSTRKVSELTGIVYTVITNIENETRPFRQAHIDLLTRLFSVTSDYLLGRSDNGFIVHTEYGDDEIILSEFEYKALVANGKITTTLIDNHLQVDVITYSKRIQEKFTNNLPKVYYRELKGKLSDYDNEGLLFQRYIALGRKMNTEELEKTISFIETYIKP